MSAATRYDFDSVNWSLILMLLTKQRVYGTHVAEAIDVSRQTICNWKYGRSRPSSRDSGDELLSFAGKYLTKNKLEECGVVHRE